MIAAAIGPVATLLSDIIKRAFPDKTEAARIEAALAQELVKADLSLFQGQLEINRVEAASQSLFVAGWRPAVGWTCAAAYAYAFLFEPFLHFWVALAGWTGPPLPRVSASELTPVLMGMLGLGTMRSFEKWATRR